MAPDEAAFRADVAKAAFRAGVAAGRWRLHGVTWPHAFIGVSRRMAKSSWFGSSVPAFRTHFRPVAPGILPETPNSPPIFGPEVMAADLARFSGRTGRAAPRSTCLATA